MEEVRGAYSVVATIPDVGLVAFRDPYGIKPICMGEKETSEGRWFACASESVVLDVNGYRRTRDVGPGEVVLVDVERRVVSRRVAERPLGSPTMAVKSPMISTAWCPRS